MAPASVDICTQMHISIYRHTDMQIIKNKINLKKRHSNVWIYCLPQNWTWETGLAKPDWDLSIVYVVGWPRRDSCIWWLSNRLLPGVIGMEIMWSFHFSSHVHQFLPRSLFTRHTQSLKCNMRMWVPRFIYMFKYHYRACLLTYWPKRINRWTQEYIFPKHHGNCISLKVLA